MFYFFCQSVKENFEIELSSASYFFFPFSWQKKKTKTKDKENKRKKKKLWVRFAEKAVKVIMLVLCRRSLLLAGLSGKERRNLTTNLLTDRNERKTEEERKGVYMLYVCHTCCFHKYEIHPSASVKLFVQFLFFSPPSSCCKIDCYIDFERYCWIYSCIKIWNLTDI